MLKFRIVKLNYGLYPELVYVPKPVQDSNSRYVRKWKTLNYF